MTKNAETGQGPPDLSQEMGTLSTVIRDLEEQLNRMMGANDALKKDLEAERARRVALEGKVAELHEQVRRTEGEVAAKETLLAEITHLTHERTRLSAQTQDLTRRVTEAEQAKAHSQETCQRLSAAKDDALQEIQSVEAQFERAMLMVAHVRAQLVVANEGREALTSRLESTEERLEMMQQERDSLMLEVEQSRAALGEIRRSLVDATSTIRQDGSRADAGRGEPARGSGVA